MGLKAHDKALLDQLASEVFRLAGGRKAFSERFPNLLRQAIDEVIDAPRTGRLRLDQLEKPEKTYIGTKVEILLRNFLKLPKGILDLKIRGIDVDIKNTVTGNWMIPREAIGKPCILVASNEKRAVCQVGLIVAHEEYLRFGRNQDKKRSISAAGAKNILWLLRDHPYPQNFWEGRDPVTIKRIFAGDSGNERVTTLFREIQDVPISRNVVDAVAQQKDFTRRVRSDSAGGTRDRLAREGIVLISGTYGRKLIKIFNLLPCSRTDYISHRLKTDGERHEARLAGFKV